MLDQKFAGPESLDLEVVLECSRERGLSGSNPTADHHDEPCQIRTLYDRVSGS